MDEKVLELWLNIKLHGEVLDQEVMAENDTICFVKRKYKYENDIYEAFVKNGVLVILKKNGLLLDWNDEEVKLKFEAVER